MRNKAQTPDYIFSASWEVCNKVGGIYTVLSTQARTLQEKTKSTVIYIGPDLDKDGSNPLLEEDPSLFPAWQNAVWESEGLAVRIGRWKIPGSPIVFLVDFLPYYPMKNWIYGRAWELFHVDSLHAYGDYDEASMFSYAAAMAVRSFYRFYLNEKSTVVYHAHEWMTGLGAMFLKHYIPQIATVFTTHATSIGRSIAGNNKPLYDYFEGYHGDQMAWELNMESKHSVEKQTAHHVDCFTTVSEITARECTQLLERTPDVITENGFENSFVPSPDKFDSARAAARKKILTVTNRLMGTSWGDDTVIIGTGGRYEFRNKGLDLFIESMRYLRDDPRSKGHHILALINVPGWVSMPREDLQERIHRNRRTATPLPVPQTTHWLHNMEEDRILNMLGSLGFRNDKKDDIHIVFVPCYLDGNDGIFNMSYYDLLIGQDMALFPSYYEPWGYTPLESAAFRVPTVTTDLAGFGLWVNSVKGRYGELADGVKVVHRSDGNWQDAACAIKDAVAELLTADAGKRAEMRRAAGSLAEKALWKHFIVHYEEAYRFAVSKLTDKQ